MERKEGRGPSSLPGGIRGPVGKKCGGVRTRSELPRDEVVESEESESIALCERLTRGFSCSGKPSLRHSSDVRAMLPSLPSAVPSPSPVVTPEDRHRRFPSGPTAAVSSWLVVGRSTRSSAREEASGPSTIPDDADVLEAMHPPSYGRFRGRIDVSSEHKGSDTNESCVAHQTRESVALGE